MSIVITLPVGKTGPIETIHLDSATGSFTGMKTSRAQIAGHVAAKGKELSDLGAFAKRMGWGQPVHVSTSTDAVTLIYKNKAVARVTF